MFLNVGLKKIVLISQTGMSEGMDADQVEAMNQRPQGIRLEKEKKISLL